MNATGARAYNSANVQSFQAHAPRQPRWHQHAACRGTNSDLFFDEAAGLPNPRDVVAREAAKKLCSRCPVIALCRELYLLEADGTFGGLDRDERRAYRLVVGKRAREVDVDQLYDEVAALRKTENLETIARRYRVHRSYLRTFLHMAELRRGLSLLDPSVGAMTSEGAAHGARTEDPGGQRVGPAGAAAA